MTLDIPHVQLQDILRRYLPQLRGPLTRRPLFPSLALAQAAANPSEIPQPLVDYRAEGNKVLGWVLTSRENVV